MARRRKTNHTQNNGWNNQHIYVAATGTGSSPEPEIARVRTEAEIASDRIHAEEWERSKKIMHPEEPAEKVEEVEREKIIAKKLEHWPWEGLPGDLLTLAPHVFSWKYKFGSPLANQSSKLLELLNICDYGNIIFPMILGRHSDACNFAMTSYESWNLMRQYIGHWDMTSGWFNNCELSPPQGTVRLERPDRILIVTPVRDENPKREPIYQNQLHNVYKFCQAVRNFADNFRILQLHRVPFLTPDLLHLLIPQMKKLQVLGVYKCPLIHVGHTLQLLDIIKTDRPQGKSISLDFFPRFHAGPIHHTAIAKYCTGNYGVTWDDWRGNSVLAIWALMARILPTAVAQGVDLIEEGTMFRKWLDMTPCVNIDAILAALMDYNMDPKTFVATVDFYNYKGSVRRLERPVLNKPEGYKWMIEEFQCTQCKTLLLGTFYYYNDIRTERIQGTINRSSSDLRCLGCKLANHLDDEDDHHNDAKSRLMNYWLTEVGGVTKIDSLDKIHNNYFGKNMLQKAGNLEKFREKFVHDCGYDREFEDLQKPLPDKAYSEKYLSPRYQGKVEFLAYQNMSPAQRQWTSSYATKEFRFWGHGHGGLD